MAQVELIMPKMGESIMEATILSWVKQPGDRVDVDDTILEIATDKVDSEVPSPVAGTITKILFDKDAVVPIGQVIAIIETEAGAAISDTPSVEKTGTTTVSAPSSALAPSPSALAPLAAEVPFVPPTNLAASTAVAASEASNFSDRFYSPLVRAMAEQEKIGRQELDQIPGSGKNGRLTKSDMEAYLKRRDNSFIHTIPTTQAGAAPSAAGGANQAVANTAASPTAASPTAASPTEARAVASATASKVLTTGADEIIEMDRMRRLIADHMVLSKKTSAHVTSFVEADVTNMVQWRERVKDRFQQQYGEKITFTPIFIEAVARALTDFPMVNVSVEGHTIIKKKNINVGMAAALPSGNLIVPVIKQADQLNLLGLTKAVNDLANRARANKLKPEDTQGGTFTLTNVGSFGNVMGTPIINQPQVAILAVGTIKKKPAVVETPYGDLIAVRHLMFMSLSYDHRVVDGALGGSFLRRVADYLEAFDTNRSI